MLRIRNNTIVGTRHSLWEDGAVNATSVHLTTTPQPMFTKEKSYAVATDEEGGWLIKGLSQEEAEVKAEELATKHQTSIYIMQVHSVVKPERKVVRELW